MTKYWRVTLKIEKDDGGPCDTALEMALSLPYLPAQDMEQGITAVISYMNDNYIPESARFERYMRRQWLRVAAILSVVGSPIKTNNAAEADNMEIQRRMGGPKRKPLWLYLGMF